MSHVSSYPPLSIFKCAVKYNAGTDAYPVPCIVIFLRIIFVLFLAQTENKGLSHFTAHMSYWEWVELFSAKLWLLWNGKCGHWSTGGKFFFAILY